MRTDLLQALKTELETNVKDENFCINIWKCGTQGCAIGVAAGMPIFQEAGLMLVRNDESSHKLMPVFKEYISWDAVHHLFEITQAQSEYMFGTWRYNQWRNGNFVKTTPKEVAERIGRVLVGHGGGNL